jgi:hypothetical protein
MPDFPTPAPTRLQVNLGAESKLYRNTGTFGSPTWTPVTNASDSKVGEEADDITITRKGAGRNKEHIGGGDDFPLDFTMRTVKKTVAEAAEILVFLAAKKNRTPLDLLSLDGDISDPASVGWRGAWKVQSMMRDEKDHTDTNYAVKCQPAPDLENPVRLVYADGEGGIVNYEAPVEEE